MRSLVYDLTLMRPGCVLLQSVMGGSIRIGHMFPNDCWLLTPTPDLKCYRIPEEELQKLVRYHGGIYTSG